MREANGNRSLKRQLGNFFFWALEKMENNWEKGERDITESNFAQMIPSGNQTWQWKMDHFIVIFLMKHPFIEIFRCHV